MTTCSLMSVSTLAVGSRNLLKFSRKAYDIYNFTKIVYIIKHLDFGHNYGYYNLYNYIFSLTI